MIHDDDLGGPSPTAVDTAGSSASDQLSHAEKAQQRIMTLLSTIDVVVFNEKSPDGQFSAWVAQARQIENAQQGETPEQALVALRRCLLVDAVYGAAIGARSLSCPDDVWLRLISEPSAILYKLRFDVQEAL